MKNAHSITSFTLCALALLASASFTPASGQVVNESHQFFESDPHVADLMAWSVAISGDTLVAGARLDLDGSTGTRPGSVFLFDLPTGAQTMQLNASDAADADYFGHSVGISGDVVVVGAMEDDDNGEGSGSAYLFSASTGNQLAKLLPDDGAAEDGFGCSVAISGDMVIVGSWGDDDLGSGTGSAYLFDASTGVQIAKLLPSDGGQGPAVSSHEYFGYSVAISGSTVIIGAPFHYEPFGSQGHARVGAAYLFDAVTGNETAKLLPDAGLIGSWFGASVAVDNTKAIVGALADGDNGYFSGAAYLFDQSTGLQIAKLLPNDGDDNDEFGFSVAISGDVAIIGAVDDEENGAGSGSAYRFDSDTGAQVAKLLPSDGHEQDAFGCSVAIEDGKVIVGTPGQGEWPGSGKNSGSAYLFYTETPEMAIPFCFGDGTGTPCPCNNSGGPDEGCANDTGIGAILKIDGSTSVSADDLTLHSLNLTPGPGLYFQGNNAINSGNGNPFGDGLRCVGNSVIRLEVQFSSGGSSSTTISIATKGGVSAGETKYYQHWYRDTDESPCDSGFNLTNGIEITWVL